MLIRLSIDHCEWWISLTAVYMYTQDRGSICKNKTKYIKQYFCHSCWQDCVWNTIKYQITLLIYMFYFSGWAKYVKKEHGPNKSCLYQRAWQMNFNKSLFSMNHYEIVCNNYEKQ